MERGSQPAPGHAQAGPGACPLGARPLLPFSGEGLAWPGVLDQLQGAEAKAQHSRPRRRVGTARVGGWGSKE